MGAFLVGYVVGAAVMATVYEVLFIRHWKRHGFPSDDASQEASDGR